MSAQRMAAMLALVFALSPLAIDMYLPTFPAIASSLGASTQNVAATISIYVFGFSLGQFVGGPLSDYRGRRPIMILGLAVFCAASLVLAMSNDIGIFWAFRFIQAIGGGIAAVGVPAMIRDRAEGQEAAKLFALIGFITIFAPAIAPALGTLLFKLSGWRAVFYALAAYAALALVLIWVRLRPVVISGPAGLSQSLMARYRFVLSNGVAMRYLLAQGMALSVMITFLAHASFVYMEIYGASESLFSVLFAANVVTMAVCNRLNHVLLGRYAAGRILVPALVLQGAATVVLLAVTGLEPSLWLVVPLIMLAIGILGCVMGNSQACMLDFFPHHSGIASALMGSGQFLIAAIVSGISTLFYSDQMWPMTVTMAVASLLAFLIVPSHARLRRAVETVV